jgi:flagellar assembly protein FliH
MAMIKSRQADTLSHQAIVLDLGDLRRQAAELRAAAEAEAQRIIADAEHRAAQLGQAAEQEGRQAGQAAGHAAGYAAGLDAGRKQGYEQALAQHQPVFEQIQKAWIDAAGQWDAQRRQMIQEARQSVLKLAVEMARKIVHRVALTDSQVIVDQVVAAIEHVARPCDVRVLIHPDDRPALQAAMPELARQLTAAQHVTLADDPSIQRGGCVVTYGQGRIDATLQTQLERLVEAMLGNAADSLPHTTQPPHAEEGAGE